MGNFQASPPQPITVHVHYAEPRTRNIDGYTEENNYTLNYTLLHGYHTVEQLKTMTQQHSSPTGNGIVGFSRTLPSCIHTMISSDTLLNDDETVFLVV